MTKLNNYDVYTEYCKKKKPHGLRLRSIMRVFNYIYRNNKIIYEETLNRWYGIMKKDEKTVREEFIEYAKEHGIEIKLIPNKDDPDTFEKIMWGYDLSSIEQSEENKKITPSTMAGCDNPYFHMFTLFGGMV